MLLEVIIKLNTYYEHNIITCKHLMAYIGEIELEFKYGIFNSKTKVGLEPKKRRTH